jgi:hypothetical protein
MIKGKDDYAVTLNSYMAICIWWHPNIVKYPV